MLVAGTAIYFIDHFANRQFSLDSYSIPSVRQKQNSSSISTLFFSSSSARVNCLYFQLLVDDLIVWTGILDKMDENDDGEGVQVPFNTILFSNERILTEHERHTLLEYVKNGLLFFSFSIFVLFFHFFSRNKNTVDSNASSMSTRDTTVDYCKCYNPPSLSICWSLSVQPNARQHQFHVITKDTKLQNMINPCRLSDYNSCLSIIHSLFAFFLKKEKKNKKKSKYCSHYK